MPGLGQLERCLRDSAFGDCSFILLPTHSLGESTKIGLFHILLPNESIGGLGKPTPVSVVKPKDPHENLKDGAGQTDLNNPRRRINTPPMSNINATTSRRSWSFEPVAGSLG